jgi:hypothetical protein
MRCGPLLVTSLLCSGLFIACASGPRGAGDGGRERRMKDSAPEKIAAQRAAIAGANDEAEERRWGFEAARERKRRTDEKRSRPQDAPYGPVDFRGQPTLRVGKGR